MWLFLIFVAVPIIEIGLFIQVGGAIGLWPTLAIVILTAFSGTMLMRAQGAMTLQKLQAALSTGQNPADPMVQGAMILVAGVLLLTPGFFTDAFGLALLIPPVRVALIKWGSSRIATSSNFSFSVNGQNMQKPQNRNTAPDVVEAEYSIVDEDDQNPPENPSGWTKH